MTTAPTWKEKMAAVRFQAVVNHDDPENIVQLKAKIDQYLHTQIDGTGNDRFKGHKQVSFCRLVKVIKASVKKLAKLQLKKDHWSHRWQPTLFKNFSDGHITKEASNLFSNKVQAKYYYVTAKYKLELACLKQATDRLKPEFGIDWEASE